MRAFHAGALFVWRSAPVLSGLLVLIAAGGHPAVAQVAQIVDLPPETWSSKRAMEHLQWYPRDSFRQYVFLQLAHREGKAEQATRMADRLRARDSWGDRRQVNLFAIFSGALAVQESMQLEALTPGRNRNRQRRNRPPEPPVPLEKLRGPQIKSHPWKKMLGSHKPQVSPLALCVPQDFYFVRFRSAQKFLAVLEELDRWGRHLMSQAASQAYSYDSSQRAMQQLALPVDPLARHFYDTVVQEIAVTGSDPYVRIGSDVTVLIRFRHPQVFRSQVKAYLDQAAKEPDAVVQEEEYRGVKYTHVSTPDRRVHVYSAYPRADLLVRSNSLPAFQRVLDVVLKAPGAVALGQTDEFRYVRTLMPPGAEEEDGLVYLSDAFMRRLVGPRLKLTHRRRMLCYNHLRMLTHAAGLYWLEHRKAPTSLGPLYRAGCTPSLFGQGRFTCPDGGTYQLASGGLIGTCSLHGRADRLTPCLELPLEHIQAEEARLYRQFVARYSQYWRTFFDPIAIRVKVEPKQFRVETLVLPLIDSSIYQGLRRLANSQPRRLALRPIPGRSVFTFSFTFNKQLLARYLDLEPFPAPDPQLYQAAQNLRRVALALRRYHEDRGHFPPPVVRTRDGKPLKHPYSWRVAILPYLDWPDSYLEWRYKYDQAWNSPQNRKLLEKMPDVFRMPGAGEGTTMVQMLVSEVFPAEKPTDLARLKDDGAKTAMLVLAPKAVPWTKPEDVSWNGQGAFPLHRRMTLVAMANGDVWLLRPGLQPELLRPLVGRFPPQEFTPAALGMRIVPLAPKRATVDLFGGVKLDAKVVARMLQDGIGDQVTVHWCDTETAFELDLAELLGLVAFEWAADRGHLPLGYMEYLVGGVLLSSLYLPVVISVPIHDTEAADQFFQTLDRGLAEASRPAVYFFFSPFRVHFYREPVDPEFSLRTFTLQLGPLRWRMHGARIGSRLYLTTREDLMHLLRDLHQQQQKTPPASAEQEDAPSHVTLQVHPQHMNRLLLQYRRGWAERHQQACLDNLGRLQSLAYLAAAQLPKDATAQQVRQRMVQLARRFYGVRFYCAEGGHYSLAPRHVLLVSSDPENEQNGAVFVRRIPSWQAACSVHGTAQKPRHGGKLHHLHATNQLAEHLRGISIRLMFLEDGLRAVAIIRRK